MKTSLLKRQFYRLIKSFLCLFIPLFRLHVSGREFVPTSGKVVITPNHVSFWDALLLALVIPGDPVFVVNTGIAQLWYMRLFLPLVDTVIIDSRNPMAIKRLVGLLNSERSVVIFPEGRITVTGTLMKMYDGPAWIAAKTDAPIVPVYIDGAIHSRLSRMRGTLTQHWFPQVTISFLPPQSIVMPDIRPMSERWRLSGERLRDIMMDARITARAERTLFESMLYSMKMQGAHAEIVTDLEMKPNTYRDLMRKMLGFIQLLEPLTAPKERVGLLLPNSAAAVAAIYALSIMQRTPAMLNYTAGEKNTRASLIAAEIQQIITSRQFLTRAKLTTLPEQFPEIHWIFLEDLASQITFFDRLLIAGKSYFPRWLLHRFPLAQPSDEALILFTSGSEGYPKGVVHSHNSLLSNVEQICTVADFTPKDKIMMALPVFHAFGLTVGVVLPMATATQVMLYPNPLHYRIVPEMTYDQNCTILFGTSTFLRNYARYAHAYDFSRVRYVVAGAEKLAETTQDTWMERFGIRILEGYGATECAPVISINLPMAYRRGSVGRLMPGMKAELLPIQGMEQGGQLIVSGPNVMLGYLRYENPGVLEAVENHSYDTGDIAAIDAKGFLTLHGRTKRFAKIAGEMISLEMVENIATKANPDALHAAASRPDATRGEVLVLFTSDPDLKRSQLLAAARASGASDLAVAQDIRYLKEIPLLGSGKPDLQTIKQLALEFAA